MPTPIKITDEIVRDTMIKAMQNVFAVMLKQNVSFVKRLEGPQAPTPGVVRSLLIGSVGFGGTINGLVYLAMADEYARYSAGRMLGLDLAELLESGPEAVNDAIGEITNMMVGTFKNSLADMGYPCKLTVPSIIRGRNLSVNAIKGTVRHLFQFSCGTEQLMVDLHMHQD